MEDLIIAVLQFLFEFLLEVFSYIPFDWPFTENWPERLSARCFLWFGGGCVLAYLSVLFLTHTWISMSALRIVNLVLAPLTSAFVSQAIARRRRRRHASIIPRNHFWQAFWFTAGIVTVRFAYTVRH